MMAVSQRSRAQLRSLGTGPLQPMLARWVGLFTRGPHSVIADQQCRGQRAGEREPYTDHHHRSEPGDEGLLYGALDLRGRPCVYTLRCLRSPEVGLRSLQLAANLTR